jgi:hypothetical protein
MSDQSIQNMITAPNNRVGRLLAGKATDIEALEDIFVAAMARLPTTKERQMFALHRANQERRRTFEDVLWAVMNTKEFTRRH